MGRQGPRGVFACHELDHRMDLGLVPEQTESELVIHNARPNLVTVKRFVSCCLEFSGDGSHRKAELSTGTAGCSTTAPLNQVMESLDPSLDVPKQVVVINLFAGPGLVPQDLMGVYNRVLANTFSNEFQSDLEDARKVNDYIEVVDAIDQALPADHPSSSCPATPD